MDFTHDFETSNAREWDESSQAFQIPPPGSGGNTSETLPIITTGSMESVRKSTYTGKLPTQSRILNSNLRRNNSQPTTSDATRRWAKGPQLVTTVRAESQKVDEEVAMQRKLFKSNPTQSDFHTTSYYFWPNRDIPPVEILGDNLQKTDPIREVYKAFIDWDFSMQSLRIRSPTGQNINEVVEALRAVIQAARVETAGCVQCYIVQPPSAASITDRVSPIFGGSTSLEHQPLIEGVKLTGKRLSGQKLEEWERQKDVIANKQKHDCYEKLHEASSKLRALRIPMRLRAHFGAICISVYKKSFQSSNFDYAALCTMMSECRTKATLDKNIRPPLDGLEILRKINSSQGIFFPDDPFASLSLEDVKPKHGLVILARTPTDEQLRLEADIDKIQEGGIGMFQIGTVNYYLHDTHVPRLTVAVMNLEGYSDWALEIITNMQISEQPPKALQDLIHGCISRSAAVRVGDDGVPYPAINLQVPPGVTIDGVVIKNIRQYRLQQATNLLIEITTYRKWCTQDTTGDPTVAYGVTLYDKDWDRTLAPSDELSRTRPFSADLSELFPAGNNLQSGFEAFWASVSRTQEFLSKN